MLFLLLFIWRSSFCRHLHDPPLCWLSLETTGNQNLSLFTRFSPLVHVSGEDWKAVVVIIYMIIPSAPYLWRGLGRGFCSYLRDSPNLCLSLERIGKQFLSLFTWFSPLLPVSGEDWEVDFVVVYVILPTCACLWRGLGSSFCRCLRDSSLCCLSLERTGKQILSLFTWVSSLQAASSLQLPMQIKTTVRVLCWDNLFLTSRMF